MNNKLDGMKSRRDAESYPTNLAILVGGKFEFFLLRISKQNLELYLYMFL